MSSTEQYFKFFYETTAKPPADFDRSLNLQLTQLEVKSAQLSKPLNAEDDRYIYLDRLATVTTILADQPDQPSYQALTRMTPTIQDLRAASNTLDNTKNQLKRTYDDTFKNAPYEPIMEMHRNKRPKKEIKQKINELESTQNKFAKAVENYRMNAEATEARLIDTSNQYIREAKALTGSDSLVIPTQPSKTAGAP